MRIPATAVSGTYRKQEKAVNPGSIRVIFRIRASGAKPLVCVGQGGKGRLHQFRARFHRRLPAAPDLGRLSTHNLYQ